MKIKHPAVCGTLESSDVMITVSPGDGEICIDLDSTVDMYYHDKIIKVMKELLALEGISSAKIKAVDHGALDCTIKARLKTALVRSSKEV